MIIGSGIPPPFEPQVCQIFDYRFYTPYLEVAHALRIDLRW